jgi:hypothetical protein
MNGSRIWPIRSRIESRPTSACPEVFISAIASKGVRKTPSRLDADALTIAPATLPRAIEVKLMELCTVEGHKVT